ncbi:hypothetical protein BXZ70DRAFT_199227 [Cristinia sonorae]|uniref:Uncharacterized protein n=1 Tax=Cristinia sonorae TaxID=1940300 RepID=A0A8K0UN79_9AGAR|nr:hypothetical protein BXZ70DRAFT_199227 [Cristinia sonorae]
MNTVFRDASAQLFDNRKTFTAIKSCYHRNVETFRQIYSLEKYLIHTTMPDLSGVPPPDYAPLPNPATFESSSDRLAFIDRRLEAARAVSVETGVGNVSAKVIEHWCRKGWYVLFKRRFKEEDEGQIVPYFGKDPSQSLLGKGLSHPAAILFPQPDPPDSGEQDEDEDADAEGSLPAAEETAEQETSATPKYRPALIKSRPRKRTPAALASNTPRFRISNPQKAETSSASASQTQAQPSSPAAPAATSSSYNTPPVASYPGYPAHPYPPATAHMYPPPSPHFDYSQAYPPGAYAVPNPHVQQLTQLAMNLITSCTTLVDQLRERAEEGRELVELLRKREEREKAAEEEGGGKGSSAADRKEKVAVATQILADPNADEEIKQAAKDFLKRLFA